MFKQQCNLNYSRRIILENWSEIKQISEKVISCKYQFRNLIFIWYFIQKQHLKQAAELSNVNIAGYIIILTIKSLISTIHFFETMARCLL